VTLHSLLRRKPISLTVSVLGILAVAAIAVFASGDQTSAESHGLLPATLIGVAVMLVVAKIGGEIFERFGQSGVLGELVGGIALGNLVLFGFHGAESLRTNETIAALAELGVIILLFEVGLESDLKEMMEVGWSSLLVALLGVVAPFILGWTVSAYFIPNEGRLGHIFIGAVLCATSVGITARVFKDLGKLGTREARIILGAAVIDDVLGLLILAVVAGAIKAAGAGTTLALLDIVLITVKALAFLVVAVVIGRFMMPRLLRGAGRFETRGVLLTFAISACFLLAWAASKVGLAPIVGAFSAGLILDDVHYQPRGGRWSVISVIFTASQHCAGSYLFRVDGNESRPPTLYQVRNTRVCSSSHARCNHWQTGLRRGRP
jgi:Kef-type K+ transport system membrane component KefB